MTQIFPRNFLFIVALLIVVGLGYYILTTPDRRSIGDKVGDALHELPNGVDKAARQLESRTPGDKLHDAAKDVGDNIRKATNQQ